MMPRWPTVLLAVPLTLGSFSCKPGDRPAAPAPTSAAAGGQTTAPAVTTQPAIEAWDGGIAMLDIKPALRLAVWQDGRVLFRTDAAGRRSPCESGAPGPLHSGRAAPAEVQKVLQAAEQAGFFHPPIDGPVVVADGPMFTITLRTADKQGELVYHGGALELYGAGPTSSPTRAQLQAFHTLWTTTRSAIDRLAVSDEGAYQGPEPVHKTP